MGIGRNWDRAPFISSSGGPILPLDVISGCVAAYSNRKLRTAYAGNSINVRRSSDSAVQNIGFSGVAFDAGAYTTFIGADSGFDATFYDQSLTNDMVQANPTSQPPVGLSASFYGIGVGVNFGSQVVAAPDTASDQDIFTSGGFAISVVNASLSADVSSIWSKGTWVLYGYPGGGGMQLWWYRKGSGGDGFWGTNNLLPTGKHIVSVSFNDTTPTVAPVISIDGTVCTFGTTNATSGAAISDHGFPLELINNTVINSNDRALVGTLYEAMFFKGPVSAPDQATLLANMKAYYSIP